MRSVSNAILLRGIPPKTAFSCLSSFRCYATAVNLKTKLEGNY
jgi:hypothetical protein